MSLTTTLAQIGEEDPTYVALPRLFFDTDFVLEQVRLLLEHLKRLRSVQVFIKKKELQGLPLAFVTINVGPDAFCLGPGTVDARPSLLQAHRVGHFSILMINEARPQGCDVSFLR